MWDEPKRQTGHKFSYEKIRFNRENISQETIKKLIELMPSRCGKSPDNTNISHYINKISIFFPPFELITEW